MARVIRKFPIKCEIHFNAVVLLALTSFFTLQSNQDQWLDSLETEYLSHIFSVSKLVPARTQFNYQGIIPFDGTYNFLDNGEQTFGSLTNCKPAERLTIICIWSDKYGSGYLFAHFSDDVNSFEGYWGANNEKPDAPWNGIRSN